MQFTSFEELQNHLNETIWDTLSGPVAQYIKETIRKNVIIHVYNSYTPSPRGYKRRGELKNINNYFDELKMSGNTGELHVIPRVESSPSVVDKSVSDLLSLWIEEGDVPNIFNDWLYPWMGPRSFVEFAKDEVKASGKIKQMLKTAIKG